MPRTAVRLGGTNVIGRIVQRRFRNVDPMYLFVVQLDAVLFNGERLRLSVLFHDERRRSGRVGGKDHGIGVRTHENAGLGGKLVCVKRRFEIVRTEGNDHTGKHHGEGNDGDDFLPFALETENVFGGTDGKKHVPDKESDHQRTFHDRHHVVNIHVEKER